MIQAEIKLEGADELDKKLRELIKSLSPEVVEPILLEGAKVIADDARRRAPKGPTGNLRKGIISKRLQKIGNNPRSALAGINYRRAPHAHLIEYGTGVRIAKKGKYKGRNFGIVPARPFFRPAWDTNKRRVKEEIIRKLSQAVEDSVK